MVSEVSAIEVASTTLRCPWLPARWPGPAPACPAHHRAAHTIVGSPMRSCSRSSTRRISPCPGRNASTEPLPHAGPQHGIRHLILEASGGIAAEITCLDREGAACTLDNRCIAEELPTRPPSSVADMTRMRRSSLSPRWHSSARASPRSASRERSWNSSNSTAAMPVSPGSSRIMRVNTPSVTTSIRVLVPISRHARPQSDPLADGFRQGLCHALGGRPRSNTTRLQHQDLSTLKPAFAQQSEGNAGRLSGAGRSDEDGGCVRGHCRPQFVQDRVNRKPGGKPHAGCIWQPRPFRK